jgi:hypothetical protein
MLRFVLLAGGAIVLFVLLWWLGPSSILDVAGRIGWLVVPIMSLGAANHMTRALALRMCVVRAGVIGYGGALAIRLSGDAVQSLTFTGPVLAEPTKAWLLEARGLTRREGFAATITEYLIYTFVAAAMSIAGFLYLIAHVELSSGLYRIALAAVCMCVVFLVASAIAIARRFYLIGTVISGLAALGLLRGRLKPDMIWINRMEDLLLNVLRDSPVRFATIVLIEAAAQLLLVFELFWLLSAMEVITSWWRAFAIEASVKIFGFVFVFVPLQLGVSEGSHALMVGAVGLPPAAGFAVAFLRRVRSLIVASVGLAMLGLLTRRARMSDF